MAGFGKLVMAALAVSLVPYELKKGEDGSFSYKSLLLNVDSRKDEAGEKKVTVSFFNKPDFMKKPAAEDAEAPTEEAPVEEAPVEEAPVEEVPVEEAPVEEAPAEEAPAEENPVPSEEPVNE